MKKKIYPDLSIVMIGHVDHGKCIHPESFILLNDSIKTGNEIIEEAERYRIIEKGKNYIIKEYPYYVYTLDKDGKIKRVKPLVYIEDYEGEMYKIITQSGKEIIVTPNHPFLVNKDGKLFWIKAKDLKEGDYIAVLRRLKESSRKIIVNTRWKDILEKKGYVVLDWKSIEGILKKENITEEEAKILAAIMHVSLADIQSIFKARKSNYKDLSYFVKILAKERIKLEELKNKIIIVDRNYNDSLIIEDLKIDENLIKFLALFYAEGSLFNKRISLSQKKEIELLDEILRWLHSKIITISYNNKDYYINSKLFIEYLKAKFNLSKELPYWILKLPKELKRVFLSYFFSFEADINKTAGEIIVTQKSYRNIIILQHLLLYFGILSQIRKKIVNGKEYYELIISGYNLYLFAKKIGLSSKEKERKLKEMLKKFGKYSKYSIPIDPEEFKRLNRMLKAGIKNQSWYLGFRDALRKKKITYSMLTKYFNFIKKYVKTKEQKQLYLYLKRKYLGYIWYDKVIKIEKIYYKGKIIDLHVPGTHNFFANGILVHNTTLTQALTGKWVDTYSEEIKRGITIKLGYADFTIYKDPSKKEPECYTTKPCENCEPVKKISIVDAPGHEALISTMLSGAAIVDAAILVIAANEPCPQPQTKEHLMAFKLLGDKPIIVVQNKIDLVTKEQALENYKQIRKFLEDFGYDPDEIDIIPVSALHNVNIDVLLEALAKLPVPKRDLESDPIFLVSRSFDVNKPGTPIEKLVGGVLGGSLIKGKLKVGQEIEIRPGIYTEEGWEPLYTYIESINQGGYFVEEARPGGTVGIATTLDPSLTKEDGLAGQVVGLPGKLPPEWKDVTLEIHLFEKVLGTEEEMRVEPIKLGEELMLNAYSIVSVGRVIDVRKDEITVRLLKPILGYEGDKVVISRKIKGRWRIIGYGNIK